MPRKRVVPAKVAPPSDLVDARSEAEKIEDEQLGFVVALVTRGYGLTRIVEACRAQYAFGRYRTVALIRKAREGLRLEVEDRKPFAKVEQIARVRARISELAEPRYGRALKDARGRLILNEDGTPKRQRLPIQGSQIARFEELLADLEGNREPVKVAVEVTMSVALRAVMANMSPERMQELAERARDRKRLALVAGGKVA